ncbi:DNA polymerase III subunit beta [Candidatus Nitrosacidococcus tergens]|uniref:Beta sliding clamp n=1 Tax=Candidatus Nitrosacidococcus tergens TaxID=553981 RepID=A0A7G1Q750_9GAMM|nr:DNA polymerase III subunit beta [Candidatus Nitrosacidococcus tergens]CAB1274098.1 DNA polymerase III subunit beta [Candidatus Nitrosacidococcus tergens]
MHFLIECEEIIKHLIIICGVVERRNTLPILSNALLIAQDQALTLVTTNLDIEIKTTLSIQQRIPGRVTVSAKKILDICRTIPPQSMLEIQKKNEQLYIKAENNQFILSTLPVDNFPLTEGFSDIDKIELTQIELKNLLQQAAFCMANQDARYYLNGLLIEIESCRISAVATDGHRLAISCLAKNFQDREKIQIIIPRKGVLELIRLLGQTNDLVILMLGSNQLKVEFQGFSLLSKLIDGQFPDYKQVLPAGYNKQLNVHREMLKQALVKANILTKDKFHGVRLELLNSKLQITATNNENETAKIEIEANYTGDALEIAFNNTYLIEILSNITTDEVKLEFINNNNSCLITPISNQDNYKYILMPMRL